MKVRYAVALVTVGALALASCGNGGAPSGQVAAKVGKQEITMIDLQSELKGMNFPTTQARQQAERQALQQIIQRKVLAAAAEKEKLDKTPEFARDEKRARELLLIKALQDKMTAAVPPPNADEVRAFVTSHPELYSARRQFQTDTIRFPMTDPSIIEALRPLNTMQDVLALLRSRNVPVQTGTETLDALGMEPTITSQLLKLPANDVFVVPQGQVVLVGHIREVDIVPVPDATALKHAANYLKLSRTRDSVTRRGQLELANAKADVEYNKAFEPPSAKDLAAKAAAPAKPAAAPAP